MHARFRPRAHRFVYRLFMVALDLDELDLVQRRLRLFSVNRPNLFGFRERDFLPLTEARHHPTPAQPDCHLIGDTFSSLKVRVLALLAAHGIDPGPGPRIELVTLPRMLGYLFNPVAFFFVSDAAGQPVAAIPQVTNTFHELKPYVLGPATLDQHGTGPRFRHRVPKHFYVSPFSDVDLAFDFNLRVPDARLAIQIDDHDATGRTLTSTLTGPARPLTDATLAWFLIKYPFLTLRVIALIHWHAFLLWTKRVPWFAKGARAEDQRDLYHPHPSVRSAALSGRPRRN